MAFVASKVETNDGPAPASKHLFDALAPDIDPETIDIKASLQEKFHSMTQA